MARPRGFLDQAEAFIDGTFGAVESFAGTSRGAARSSFQVVDALDEDGEPVWIVTDGRERAVCSSEALARRIFAALD